MIQRLLHNTFLSKAYNWKKMQDYINLQMMMLVLELSSNVLEFLYSIICATKLEDETINNLMTRKDLTNKR